MIARLLPRDEWAGKLIGTELETVWPLLADDAQIVVVEDGDTLAACWAVFPATHVYVEGVSIAPAYRGNALVARKLLRGMRETARAMGARAVRTAAIDPHVDDLIRRLGGAELPGRQYLLPLE